MKARTLLPTLPTKKGIKIVLKIICQSNRSLEIMDKYEMDKYEMKKFLEISMPHEEMREKHVTLYDSIYKLEIAKETGVTEAIRWSPGWGLWVNRWEGGVPSGRALASPPCLASETQLVSLGTRYLLHPMRVTEPYCDTEMVSHLEIMTFTESIKSQ